MCLAYTETRVVLHGASRGLGWWNPIEILLQSAAVIRDLPVSQDLT